MWMNATIPQDSGRMEGQFREKIVPPRRFDVARISHSAKRIPIASFRRFSRPQPGGVPAIAPNSIPWPRPSLQPPDLAPRLPLPAKPGVRAIGNDRRARALTAPEDSIPMKSGPVRWWKDSFRPHKLPRPGAAVAVRSLDRHPAGAAEQHAGNAARASCPAGHQSPIRYAPDHSGQSKQLQ